MIFHDIDQNTDEWFTLRIGKITGSAVGKVMANEGKAFGKPAKDYAIQIALERITGEAKGNNYSNSHMERGHEQEPIARMLYEDEYFCDVTNGGFFDCGKQGCSPDGLVYGNGTIEIKSAIPSIHYARVKRGGLDPSYLWQFVFNLKKTEREWIDFVSYCHDYPKHKKLFVHKLHVSECKELFARLDFRLIEFESLVARTIENING